MAPKTVGRRGPKGERGERGERGQHGERGERGERGPAGPPARREDILAVIDDQISEIRKELEVQLTRFAQVQTQLDSIQATVRKLVKGD